MNKLFFIIFIVCVFSALNCTQPAPVTTKSITLTVNNFISNCKAGDATNGTSTNDVSYTATIKVLAQNSNNSNYSLLNTSTVSSPPGPDKSSFSKVINVPTNRAFQIEILIDAADCSICAVTGCNANWVLVNGVAMYNRNRPLWKGTASYGTAPAGSTLIISSAVPPSPRSTPVTCPCQIKL